MEKKQAITIFIGIIMIVLLIVYLLFPFSQVDFSFSTNDNLSSQNLGNVAQFYPNMRFASSSISYTIDDSCSLQKKNEMIEAFDIIQNLTSLTFYDSANGKINISCQEKNIVSEDGLFIAGEGGPVNVTTGSKFNVISRGEILLIRNSDCEKPNIEIHELLHVLGFDHSENPNNIMYPISKCRQTIGEDIVNKINELYSIPSLADLTFKNANVIMKGRYLDLNFSVSNEGLADSETFDVVVYGDGKEIRRFDSKPLKIGYTQNVEITNQLTSQLKINQLTFSIENNFEELDKTNNIISLQLSEG